MAPYDTVQTFLDDGIYTVTYVPGASDGHGLIVFMPFGDERNNIVRTVHLLLKRTAAAGVTSGTFDYPGMGDSRGGADACTLSACVAAGRRFRQGMAERGLTRFTMLGIRSGAFVAADLCSEESDRLVLWQPFLSGERYLKELRLKDRIRGELTDGTDSEAVRINGEVMPAEFREELAARANVLGGEGCGSACVMQISTGVKTLPQFRDLGEGVDLRLVQAPPLWNAHENWDSTAVVDATAELMEEASG